MFTILNYMRKLLLATLSLLLCIAGASAQTSKEELSADWNKLGGLYYAYPGPQSVQTPAPKGYKPFYISHFGRHGSRWIINPQTYTGTYAILKNADSLGVLTELGKTVLERVRIATDDADHRHGDLSPLGYRQHQEIAERMYNSFPEVFKAGKKVTANATKVSRVDISMFAFCDELKSHSPKLLMDVNSSDVDRPFLSDKTEEGSAWCDSDEARAIADDFFMSHVNPDRLMHSLFNSEAFIKVVDGHNLFNNLAEIATIQQNVGKPVDLYDIFTFDELFTGWQAANLSYYVRHGSYPPKALINQMAPISILRHVIAKADEAIADNTMAATLRFSHDSSLVPLATCLQLDGNRGSETDFEKVYGTFANFKVSPMGGNIQIVFFRGRKGDVIVKFLLNENEVSIPVETDMYPFYKWDDVKAYYTKCYNL